MSSKETSKNDPTAEPGANPGYALGQLARALATAEAGSDPTIRERARQKVDRWVKVFSGMLSGLLRVGARTPVSNTPAWATLEVIHGGFATGELLAGGALQPHEELLLSRFGAASPAVPRALLNSFFLSDDGIAELQQMLCSGRYRLALPEEGALLVIAWLVANGHAEQARPVLDEIAPFIGNLRFYSLPATAAVPEGQQVHLQTVAQTIQELEGIKPEARFLAQREAALIWAPLYDRAVTLFVETLDGPAPAFKLGPDHKPLRSESGTRLIEGGWPCQRYPDGWSDRARAVLDDFNRLRATHQLCRKPERRGENFAILQGFLTTCVSDPTRLSGRDVGLIRLVLACVSARRGLPGTDSCQRLRQHQADVARCPSRADFARIAIGRLSGLAEDESLIGLDAIQPLTPNEAADLGAAPGRPLPKSVVQKVCRCLAAPMETLVEMKVIRSGEMLARVVPQLVGQVRAAGLTDPDARRLYHAIYQAFRRRRSLLLLWLQSQVKFGELPWVRALDEHRQDGRAEQEGARQLLGQIVRLAVTAFPQQILPNKLFQEVRALTEVAGLGLPIVDEVAADIFMGDFSAKYLRAAQKAGEVLAGTLYERYYGIDYAQIRDINDVQPSRYGTPTSPAFTHLCIARAGAHAQERGSVARNGTVIEQEQILTTHNLAVLFDALGLVEPLRPGLSELARRCFVGICERQQQRIEPWKSRLRMVKNTAYAWRQMIFFLSFIPDDPVKEFVAWATEHLQTQRPEFRSRFGPALQGLVRAADGLPADIPTPPGEPVRARTFLGWVLGRHWLLGSM